MPYHASQMFAKNVQNLLDLLITKERFFDPGVQLFLGLLPEEAFRQLATTLEGYDVSVSGKMVYPHEEGPKDA